jgi:hypothetical protein
LLQIRAPNKNAASHHLEFDLVKPREEIAVEPTQLSDLLNDEIINITTRAPVAHTCNPNYSGGRDQEDHGSKSAQQIVHRTLT